MTYDHTFLNRQPFRPAKQGVVAALIVTLISVSTLFHPIDAFAFTSHPSWQPHRSSVLQRPQLLQTACHSKVAAYSQTAPFSPRHGTLRPFPFVDRNCHHATRLFAQPEDKMIRIPIHKRSLEEQEEDLVYYAKTVAGLVTGQSALILVAVVVAAVLQTPNYGLGPAIDISSDAMVEGILWTVPLGVLAFVLDRVEDNFPALQEVTKATQQIVLSVLGSSWKPLLALVASTALGLAAGVGEEMLFRGVMQYELGNRLMSEVAAVGLTSVIFGALHAVTPLYALLASLASVYFGWLYLATGNLAVPMACHAFYDLVAFMYAHWTVTQMPKEEQEALLRRGSES